MPTILLTYSDRDDGENLDLVSIWWKVITTSNSRTIACQCSRLRDGTSSIGIVGLPIDVNVRLRYVMAVENAEAMLECAENCGGHENLSQSDTISFIRGNAVS